MAVTHTTPNVALGSGEVKGRYDRYWKEPQPLSWWDRPENITKIAVAVVLILVAVAITHG